jgi:hypothetical protein
VRQIASCWIEKQFLLMDQGPLQKTKFQIGIN